MWLENHAINKITYGQDHATHLGILNVDCNLQNSKSTHHLPAIRVPGPGTCYNILCEIDTVSDSVFALTSSSSRLSTGPKTYVVRQKINDDDGGHASDDASHASQLCACCEPRDAHIGHTHQVPELLPQQLVLPCDVSEHAQDPLSLHVFRTVAKTREKTSKLSETIDQSTEKKTTQNSSSN